MSAWFWAYINRIHHATFVRFIHVVAGSCQFILIIPCGNIPQFIHLLCGSWTLGGFQFGTIANSQLVKCLVHAFWCTYVCFSAGRAFKSRIAGSWYVHPKGKLERKISSLLSRISLLRELLEVFNCMIFILYAAFLVFLSRTICLLQVTLSYRKQKCTLNTF